MKSPSPLWFLYFLLVVPACLKGQQNLCKQWAWHALQPEQGLSQGSNEYIFRDSENFMWISSLDGLNRFDGQTVKVYKADPSDSTSLLGNIITSHFFEDQEQNLWFSTYEGIQCYQRQTDQFSSLQIPRDTGFYQQDYQLIYLENDRLLWFRIGVGSEARLWKYDLVTLEATSVTPLHGLRFIPMANTQGELQQIITCLLPNRPGFELLNLTTLHTDTLFAASPMGQVHDVLPAERGYWIGAENGFYSYDHYFDRLEQHSLNFDPPLGNVFSVKPFDEHNLVLSSAKEGLLFFDISGKYLYQVPSPKKGAPYSIPLDQVNKIYLDEQGTVWLSSFREGIAYATPGKIKFKYDPYLEGQSITALLEWNGGFFNLVSVRGTGLILAEQGRDPWFIKTQFPSEQKEETIKALFAGEEKTIWALSSHYLLRSQSLFRGGFQTLASLPAPFLARTALSNGQQLIATYEGIYSVDLSSSPPTFTPYQALNQWQSALVTAFYEDPKGRLYLAVDASRLVILQPGPAGYQLLKTIEGTGYAKAFLEQSDTLWIATSNGLLSLDNTSLETHLLQGNDGIPAEHFYSVLPGRDQSLWLSSNQGVWQYFPGQKRSVQYTIPDGIQGLEFNTDAFLLNSRGLIWLGGTQGLNYFDPATIEPWSKTPTIQWTGLSINDEAVSLPYSMASLETLDLPYQENTLSFSFVGIEYSDPPRNQLRYRLLPIEERWVQLGAEGFARYSNLQPGRYTFEVQGANPEGIWTKTSKQIQLRIRTPWWRSWWFYALVVCSLGGIIYGIMVYRLQQALKLEKMRVKISSDLHDDVGGILSGLTMQSEILAMTAAPERKSKLERINALSRQALSRMRDTVWAIDVRKDKLAFLLDRIREHAEETLEAKDIHFNLRLENLPEDKAMHAEARQNVYLICKEAITNTAKYSNGDQMEIILSPSPKKGLKILIHDNGQVDPGSIKVAGLGLSNMRLRAERLGGSFQYTVDQGFRIEVVY